MTSIPCDIVILPTPDIAQKAIAASEQLQKFGTLFTLNEKIGPFPHISLYMTQISTDHLDEAAGLLEAIASHAQSLNLTSKKYVQAENYIDADYERNSDIADLQMTVVNTINPIRDGMREKDRARVLTSTGKVRENLEKYGYRSVGELYRPHITFARFSDEQPAATETLPNPATFSGKFVRLGLFEMGDHGTCTRLIAGFDFA